MMRVFRPLAALGAVMGLLAGCAQMETVSDRDPTLAVRGALDSQPPLRNGAVAAASAPVGAVDQRAVRGFIRTAPGARDTVAGSGGAIEDNAVDEITLDFEDADLSSVVRVMMEEGLRASYVLHPEVTGKVTLRTNRPLKKADIFPTLEEILRLNNAAIIERSGVYHIAPREEAGLSAPLVSSKDIAARGLTVRVTPLRYVAVADIAEVLEGFAPVAGSLRFDRARNIVFSIGTASEQATIMDAIATVDVNYFEGRSFALRPLREAEPDRVVEELDAVFAGPTGGAHPSIRFVAVKRMNAVMVIADEPTLLQEAMDLLRNLDQGAGETPRLHVFRVSERRASDLASILGEIFDAEVATSKAAEASALAPGLDSDVDSTDAADASSQANDAFAGSSFDERIAAEAAEKAQKREASRKETGGTSGQGGVLRLVADESTNTIVALATGEGARALEGAIRRLDTQPLQVMIEATLLEVQLSEELEYGVRWFLQNSKLSIGYGDDLGVGGADILPGFNAAFRTDDISVTLSALNDVTDVKVLSSPTLMVLDNQVASLQVGDEVPVTIRSSTSTDSADSAIVTEEDYRDTGVILKIRPSVSSGGMVTLEVHQEVSDVAETSGSSNPTFAQRQVESTISVQSGDTIALAGLIQETASKSHDGIPVLSRLPVIGDAFGVKGRASERSELLVLIRPVVVRDQAGARAATEELRRKLISLAPQPPVTAPGGQ